MGIFYFTLFVVYCCAFLARYFSIPSSVGPTNIKTNKHFIIISTIILITVSGLRNNIGDTPVYIEVYKYIQFQWSTILSEKDFGFAVFQKLLQYISKEPQLLIFVTAFITNGIIVYTFYKYARLIDIALYVYVASGMYLVTMNGVRQYLAASFIFLATKYIFDGQFKKFLVIVIISSTIHQSALILIPIYFVIRRKAWTKMTLFMLSLTIIITISYSFFSEFFFQAIEETQYGEYAQFSEGGANIMRSFVSIIPLFIAYIGREKLNEIFPKSDYIVNLSIISLIFMIIAIQNWIFARFTIYFGIYEIILLSWIVKLFKEKDQKFIYFGILICYFIYFIYEYVISQNVQYRSDILLFLN